MQSGGQYTGQLYSFGENFLSKSICSFYSEDDRSTFLAVGQSLSADNELHILEHSSENNFVLCQKIFKSPDFMKKVVSNGKEEGDIVSVQLSQNNTTGKNFLTVQNSEDIKVKNYKDKQEATAIHSESLGNKLSLKRERIELPNIEVEDVALDIQDPTKCLVIGANEANLIDLEAQKVCRKLFKDEDLKKLSSKLNLTKAAADPFDSRYCLSSGKNLILKDLRSNENCTSIENCHTMDISSVDMNPNRSNRLLTSSQDFFIKIWDQRKPDFSILTYEEKTNGIDDARFNNFYDQLQLYSTSDGFLGLYEALTVSSAPVLDLDMENEGESNVNKDNFVKGYEGCQDDSIYSICWSKGDPWVFAGMSYKADVYFDLVPESHKQKVLL